MQYTLIASPWNFLYSSIKGLKRHIKHINIVFAISIRDIGDTGNTAIPHTLVSNASIVQLMIFELIEFEDIW